MEEPQTAVSALLGLISVVYRWQLLDDWLLLYPPQVEHLWCQQKLVSVIHMTGWDCALYGKECTVMLMTDNLYLLRSPWPGINVYWPGQVGVLSNDYCHTSPYPHIGLALQCNILHPNSLTLLHCLPRLQMVARNTTKRWQIYNAPFVSWKCPECHDWNI